MRGPLDWLPPLLLARGGRRVRLLERADQVGHRFTGDFQALENWSQPEDALHRLTSLGLSTGFEHRPVWKVAVYDQRLQPTVARSERPLLYLVRRGPEQASLDRALLAEAEEAEVDVWLNQPAERAYHGQTVATGPRYADSVTSGWVFPTRLSDQVRCILSSSVDPAGYAYLAVWDGRATLAVRLFHRHHAWQEARRKAVEAFRRLLPDLDLDPTSARPLSGFGSGFGGLHLSDEAGRFYVGEAAGLQDPEWGLGLWYAVESGVLAARCLLDGSDYAAVGRDRFEPRLCAALANRIATAHLPAWLLSAMRHRVASSRPVGRCLRRHWQPTPVRRVVARRFAATRSGNDDQGCRLADCRCVWCRCAAACPEAGERSPI